MWRLAWGLSLLLAAAPVGAAQVGKVYPAGKHEFSAAVLAPTDKAIELKVGTFAAGVSVTITADVSEDGGKTWRLACQAVVPGGPRGPFQAGPDLGCAPEGGGKSRQVRVTMDVAGGSITTNGAPVVK
jgi:hypothetical protein